MAIVAFLLAPLATPATIWAAFTALHLLGVRPFADQPYAWVLQNVRDYSRIATPLAYIVTVIGGWPGYLLLRRTGRLSLLNFIVLGAVLGMLPFAALDVAAAAAELWRGAYRIDVPFPPMLVVISTMCGLASASLFWAIGVAARGESVAPPDRRMEPTRSDSSQRAARPQS